MRETANSNTRDTVTWGTNDCAGIPGTRDCERKLLKTKNNFTDNEPVD
jgi:hypothetical protein